MKITTVLAATAATAGAIMAAPIAGAESGAPTGPAIHEIGQQADLVNGPVVQGWTVTDLETSTDTIPYPVRGTLWEATATDQALQGSATPIVSNFNARAANGETYRALWQVATAQGVNPATLGPGEQTTGKLYFDVTGAQPDSVVYNDGSQDLLVWVQPAPETTPSSPRSSSSPSGSATSSAPQAAAEAVEPATPPAAAEAVEPATPGEPAPASAEVVPAPAGSSGTPLPAVSSGTPLPAATGTELPAVSSGTPLPATSSGTPLPAGAQGTPVPAGSQGTPAPAPVAPVAPAAPGAPTAQPASNGVAPASTGDAAPVPHGGQVLPTPTPAPAPAPAS